mgnify:CR=1 FL=1
MKTQLIKNFLSNSHTNRSPSPPNPVLNPHSSSRASSTAEDANTTNSRLARLLNTKKTKNAELTDKDAVANSRSRASGPAYDVYVATIAALLLITYGVVRLDNSVIVLPRNGLAAWFAIVLPFIFASVFACSAIYHYSLSVALASAFLKEFDLAAMFVAISFTTITLHLAIGSDPDGGTSNLPMQMWLDPTLVGAFSILMYVLSSSKY